MSQVIGYASIGHHSRVSDWAMTDEQSMEMDFALADLKDIMDKVFPDWDTINIEVKKNE